MQPSGYDTNDPGAVRRAMSQHDVGGTHTEHHLKTQLEVRCLTALSTLNRMCLPRERISATHGCPVCLRHRHIHDQASNVV